MEISDVRVKLIEDANDRLRAVCSVTFDGEFVVRDVKVVDGTHGLFVAMPSRKLSVHCPQCRHKNHLRARFCNDCGGKLPVGKASTDPNGRVRLHRDIAHPINPSFREMVQARVIQSYQTELDASQKPGYKPADFEGEPDETVAEPTRETTREPTREPMYEPIREPVSDPMGEPIEVSEEMTEYDALIAGLKTGSPPRGDSGRGRPPQPRPQRGPVPPPPGPRSGGERRSESDSQRRTSGGRSAPPPRQDKRSDRPAQPPPQRGPQPVKSEGQGERPSREAPAPVHYDFADEPEERTVAVAPPPAAPPRETRRVETPPVAAPPPPRQTPKDEDDSFGAGIL